MSLFENRRSRFKESGKKVPQVYRVYGEDTFLPCDAEDARSFASPFENRRGKYKEFNKSEAEAYLLYVEHSLLCNDAVIARIFSKTVCVKSDTFYAILSQNLSFYCIIRLIGGKLLWSQKKEGL